MWSYRTVSDLGRLSCRPGTRVIPSFTLTTRCGDCRAKAQETPRQAAGLRRTVERRHADCDNSLLVGARLSCRKTQMSRTAGSVIWEQETPEKGDGHDFRRDTARPARAGQR